MDDAVRIRDQWQHIVGIERDFTGDFWRLTPRSYVGQIPISKNVVLHLQPKIALSNIFYMLDVAYRSKFQLFDDLTSCDDLDDAFDRLVRLFAKRVLDRTRKGLYRTYVPDEERLAFVRGSIDIRQTLRPASNATLHCRFEEHTADVSENQILIWTLSKIVRSRICRPATDRLVRAAHRALRTTVSLIPFRGVDCVGRTYNRLNEDYRTLHHLCRFFLERMTPTQRLGDSKMLPFLVRMNELFEAFVAESLHARLPTRLRVVAQEQVRVHEDGMSCHIDLVVYDAENMHPLAVLDTKYKSAQRPKDSDIYQVVAYAEAVGCLTAVLIYPERQGVWTIARFGKVSVFGIGWPLDGELGAHTTRAVADVVQVVGTAYESGMGELRANRETGL